MSGRITGFFAGMDFTDFWDDHEYYTDNYTEPAPSDELVAEVEAELGFRLPDAYVELARLRNGGGVKRCAFPMSVPTGWAEDHISITGIYAIGRTANWSLLGEFGAANEQDEGYPAWGVEFADTPSGGHELIMLDYRACGPSGEPSVVYVDQEDDYSVTPVAPDFATFIRGLVSQESYDEALEAEMQAEAWKAVRDGTVSPILRRALDAAPELPDGEASLRRLAERIVAAKGAFVLHDDPDSCLMYDVAFWLYSKLATAASFDDYFRAAPGQGDHVRPCHVLMLRVDLVAEPYGFKTGGYAEGFARGWWDRRLADGDIVAVDGGYRFTDAYAATVLERLGEA